MKRLLAVILFASCAFGAIIPDARRITWEGNVGVEGGIPTNRTKSGATITAPSSAAAIQAALDTAAGEATEQIGKFVLLGPGTFTIDATITIPRFVTLRGSGPTQTTITGSTQHLVQLYEYQAWDDNKALSGTLAKGDTSFALTAPYAGLGAGMVVQITEANNSRITRGIEPVLDPDTALPSDPHGQAYAMGQWVRITGVNGATVTFTPALNTPYTSSPIIHFPFLNAGGTSRNFCRLAGLEDVKLINTFNASTSQRTVNMGFADQCWMKNVHSVNAFGGHVGTLNTFRCEIRQCTFDGLIYAAGSPSGPLTSSCGYGIQLGTANGNGNVSEKTSAMLIEDNIITGCRGSILLGYGATGCVVSYNYITHSVSEYIYPDPDVRQKPAIMIHSSFCTYNLVEGNITTGKGFHADLYHGNSYWNTVSRNWFKGREAGKDSALQAIEVDGYSRYFNLIGNVLGYSGITTDVSAMTSPSGVSSRRINAADGYNYAHHFTAIMLGYKGEGGSGPPWDDSQVSATTADHGNFDYVTSALRWESDNTNVLDYTDHGIPNSYVYASKPAFFGDLVWPPINASSPGSLTDEAIPAGYRYVHGSDPAITGSISTSESRRTETTRKRIIGTGRRREEE